MDARRVFVGWERPLTQALCEHVLEEPLIAPVDLSRLLLVAPTRNAGRRVREALARWCDRRGTALLGPRCVTPAHLSEPAAGAAPVAGGAVTLAAWSRTVLEAADRLQHLFPGPREGRDWAWAMSMAGIFIALRRSVAEGGLTLGDAADRLAQRNHPESERWMALKRIEALTLERLRQAGFRDAEESELDSLRKPRLPEGIDRVLVAAVPDPSGLMVGALEVLSRAGTPVTILVHAPPELADAFDSWGRPIPAAWSRREELRILDIPNPEANLRVAEHAAGQAGIVAGILAMERTAGVTPDRLTVGVPDTEVIPAVKRALAGLGLSAFDPSPRPLARHPIVRLAADGLRLSLHPSADALAALLRSAYVLDGLKERGITPTDLLTFLDHLRARHLPVSLDDLAGFAARAGEAGREPVGRGDLQRALEWIRPLAPPIAPTAAAALVPESIRAFLRAAIGGLKLHPGRPDDLETHAAAEQLAACLRDIDAAVAAGFLERAQDAGALFQARVSEEEYSLDRAEDERVDLEGWLELHWVEAPLLAVTGMNEGRVPDGRLSDPFLPDALRRELGLRNDETRLARDAYLARALIESRRRDGRVCFLAGRFSADGQPLAPSRLLLRCADEDLADRVAMFFKAPAAAERRVSPSVRKTLSPAKAAGGVPRPLERLPVTAFREYLACPFLFYMKRVLGMENADPAPVELDASAFGLLAHAALKALGDPSLAGCEDETRIRDTLRESLRLAAQREYGPRPSVLVRLQIASIEARLDAMAARQAQSARDGWRIAAVEQAFEFPLGGVRVAGRIDRIDRKGDAWRILDYKTVEKASPHLARKNHLGGDDDAMPDYARLTAVGRRETWADLQLPLYVEAVRRLPAGSGAASIEAGYLLLPAVAGDGGMDLFEELAAPAMVRSAVACAEGVAADIRAGRFWPPRTARSAAALNRTWRGFESVFMGYPPDDGVDGTGLEGAPS